MFLGIYNHKLDEKRRVSLPSKFRDDFGPSVIISRGTDKCIYVFSVDEWKNNKGFTESGPYDSNKQKIALSRIICSDAAEVDVDQSGRILVTENLSTYAELSENVVIVGIEDRVEIWDQEIWNKYQKKAIKQFDAKFN